jgi:hypothetical protein
MRSPELRKEGWAMDKDKNLFMLLAEYVECKVVQGLLYLLAYVLLALLLSGCVTQRKCLEKYPPVTSEQKSDSTVQKERYTSQDTTITTPGGEINIDPKLETEQGNRPNYKPTIQTYTDGKVTLTIAAAGDKLSIQCKADSLQLLVTKYKQELQTESNQKEIVYKTQVVEKEVTVEVPYVPAWYRWQNYIALFFELLLVGYIIYRVWVKPHLQALAALSNSEL